MTEYVALVVIVLGIMIYLIHLAFSLSDTYDPLKLLLIGVSMVFGILLWHLGKLITVEQSASAAMQNALDLGYYTWIVITCLTMAFIVVYLVIRGWNAVNTKKKITLYDKENS